MPYPSKAERFGQFVQQLNAANAAASRQAAFDLIEHTMDAVENLYGLPVNDYGERMHAYPMKEDFGWKDLSTDPCSWIDSVVASHRTEIYNSGRIVITRMKPPMGVVVDKAGA